MKYDSSHDVINAPETYLEISHYVHVMGSVFIGWTDEAGTHYDILFTKKPYTCQPSLSFQGGIKPWEYLFVSIMRVGAFAFLIGEESIHPSYIAEKLGIGSGETAGKLAELVNGVIKAS